MSEEFTYKKAGVDIEKGDELVKKISSFARATFSKNVLQDIGSFGSLVSVDTEKYNEPVLVSGTDGVGTKLKIAFMMNRHDTVGIDLVAMCVNDILTSGADPLFFLDYFATGKLETSVAEDVIKGIAEGCKLANCSLVGGETAEMPDFYDEGEYDMAGFAVGVVDRQEIIDGKDVSDGDAIIGIASSGLHSNGYSLVRKVFFDKAGYGVDKYLDELGRTLGEELLEPTTIYAGGVRAVKADVKIKAMSHITGGGIPGNLMRTVPEGFSAIVDEKSWERSAVFDLINKMGNVPDEDMKSTFNMGIGYALIVSEADADRSIEIMKKEGYNAYAVGEIRKGGEGVRYA
ncbi:MAG: phosphoribosylformylglycinamidine cyclo-ligase [Thermodesulfovibrionales bacterium]